MALKACLGQYAKTVFDYKWKYEKLAVVVHVLTNLVLIREFKKPLRRRRRQRGLKGDLYFTYESCDTLKSSTFLYHCQNHKETKLRNTAMILK